MKFMLVKGYKRYQGLVFFFMLMALFSCTDETFTKNEVEATYITIRGMASRSGATHPGTSEDVEIRTLRVIAFDHSTGNKATNASYNAGVGDVIRHHIDPGTYDFVFLANEPGYPAIQSQLTSISHYTDLDQIAYPATSFISTLPIPMMQEVKNVTVLPNGGGAVLNDGTTVSILQLAMKRLGVRVDVELKAEHNFDADFKGVVFDNIPDFVPLTAGYSGEPPRNVTREFTLADNPEYFSNGAADGDLVWVKHISRIILPASEPATIGDISKAVTFTIDMGDNYPPSCELKIAPDPVNYSLPKNTKLDLIGIIKDPLYMNIIPSEWTDVDNDWNIAGIKKLDVSDIEVNITDFNGARISFWSNMPEVKVLPKTYIGAGSTTADTEKIFNDLILETEGNVQTNGTKTTYSTSRFSYTYDSATKTGNGYMDVLLDEQNEIDKHETFRIILSAGDEDGGSLQREIKVNISQYGKRFDFNSEWGGTAYVGAFYRNNEIGERIITGQQGRRNSEKESPEYKGRIKYWKARLVDGDFVILSSTPSFDPYAGTDNPGDPEKYTVYPNPYKGEDGTYVEGKGRVYFRIGLTGKNPGANPRYARVLVTHYGEVTDDGTPWDFNEYIYIRQGEADDYIMRPGTEDPITKGPLAGQARNYARKFSAFNLTAPGYYNGQNDDYIQLNPRQGKFVKYPTQAGAFFQWGLPKDSVDTYFRLAYHPTKFTENHWTNMIQFFNIAATGMHFPVWGEAQGAAEAMYDYGYHNVFELCPDGYHRPSDGYIDRISHNGPYPNYRDQNNNPVVVDVYKDVIPTTITDYSDDIAYSEWRQSVFEQPLGGDVGKLPNVGGYDGSPGVGGIKVDRYQTMWKNADDTGEAQQYITFSLGFYADGFYDRRPIRMGSDEFYSYGVSTDNAQAAYVGLLVYNKATMASVFFPSAGRRNNKDGELQFVGETGYYNSSSIGPSTAEDPHSVWGMSFSKWPNPGSMCQLPTFGRSIRCVRD